MGIALLYSNVAREGHHNKCVKFEYKDLSLYTKNNFGWRLSVSLHQSISMSMFHNLYFNVSKVIYFTIINMVG